jgi:osmotically-inducible protein OsmY
VDLLADLRSSLAELASDLRDIGLQVERGVAQLTGTVPDAGTKREIEASVRSNPGVVHVENAITTDAAIRARVSAGLAADRRTDVAVIDVESDRAVVTLSGYVDSEDVREAAEEIASQQPGVTMVVNALEVSPDEHSRALRYRPVVLPSEEGSGVRPT